MATYQVPEVIDQLATREASRTGLNKNVILSQWIAENYSGGPSQFYNHMKQIHWNFGNIKKIGGGGYVQYGMPEQGADGYGDFYFQNSIYQGVRDAIASKDPNKQLQAVIDSGWSENHYSNGTLIKPIYNDLVKGNYKVLTGDGTAVDTNTNPGGASYPTANWGLPDIGGGVKMAGWLLLGIGLIVIGIIVTTNPLSNLNRSILAAAKGAKK